MLSPEELDAKIAATSYIPIRDVFMNLRHVRAQEALPPESGDSPLKDLTDAEVMILSNYAARASGNQAGLKEMLNQESVLRDRSLIAKSVQIAQTAANSAKISAASSASTATTGRRAAGWSKWAAIGSLVAALANVFLGYLTWQQFRAAEAAEQLKRSAKWGELHGCMLDIMAQFPKKGTAELRAHTLEQHAQWLRELRRHLESQIDNPVLLADAASIGHWRNAISGTRIYADIYSSGAAAELEPELLQAWDDGLYRDVMFVWDRLVLKSKEVSATGGLPNL